MLVSGIDVMKHAHRNGYAVGAFNVNNMEAIQAIIEAAEELQSPVIIQASQGGLKYAGVKYMAAMVKVAAEVASVPVVLHLDHGTEFSSQVQCLQAGWTSLMIDASHYDLQENIAKTKEIVEMAHQVGVGVEAELGKIGGVEDDIAVDAKDAVYTEVDEAYDFVCATGVDYLAIAVGTAHGPYKGDPKIDFTRIAEIKAKVNMPLVLHGSSGLPKESIEKAIAAGINKINIDTDLRQAYHRAVKKFVTENPDIYDPRKINAPGKEAMKEVAKDKMRMFNSVNQAWR
ncbi:class II fructose-1,6-bisphosphate aldolase [Gottschalkiaceae bacterium SANA]|nr:class II fructose-1,6-bisphosphate aldolase [Gottschalkiaceae bacterium SANA]